MMVSIIEIVPYTKPTAEHQYLSRSSCLPLHTKRAFPSRPRPDNTTNMFLQRNVQSWSPQPGDRRCSYYHTHSHKRLTHTYPSSCRIPPSHSSISFIFHRHIYILSSSQHFASLFKYIYTSRYLPTVLTSRKFAKRRLPIRKQSSRLKCYGVIHCSKSSIFPQDRRERALQAVILTGSSLNYT